MRSSPSDRAAASVERGDLRIPRKPELLDIALVVVTLCTIAIAAIVVLHFAGYSVPAWSIVTLLLLCLAALAINVRARRRNAITPRSERPRGHT